MIQESQVNRKQGAMVFLLFCLFFVSASLNAATLTINMVDSDGVAVSGFRYQLEEDKTFDVDPNNPATNPDDLLSMSFHASNHPVATSTADGSALSGNEDTGTATVLDVAAGRYYVSVLPYEGYSISGKNVAVAEPGSEVTVVVQKQPIPTAQISIYLFHDNYPINGAPDLPEETNPEPGLPGHVDWSQFSLFLEEPGGRYGIAGGQVIQDAFGNGLGTTYVKGCDADGNPDANPFTDYGCLDADGAPMVASVGDGTLHPDENGYLTVENLAPGKYGVVIIPPPNSGWQQTSTIEGSKVIDAWVKANEPPVFVEFGLPGPHVFMGFVRSTADGGFDPLQPPLAGQQTANVSGVVTDMHMSRAPNFQFFSGRPFPQCWIGLNETQPGGLLGAGLYASPCDGDSAFSIANVPPGSYQLAIWDANLDVVFAAQPFTVDETGGTCNNGNSCDFGEVAVFNWFTRLNTAVFKDLNENGFWDVAGEDGIEGTIDDETGIGPESQEVVLRWRDGSIYQAFPTDGDGLAPFDEIFPFFHWLVAEVSFGNKKATGATFVVDAGGEVLADDGWNYPSFDELTPLPQVCTSAQSNNPEDPNAGCTVGDPLINPNTGNNLSVTETGQVLTAAFQGFLGQTSVMQFGKTDYMSFTPFDFSTFPPTPSKYVGENGGISGIVFYATTRAEDDPQFAAAEEWEPGVPRVQIALYADGDVDCFPQGDFPNSDCDIDWNQNGGLPDADDGVIDDVNGSGAIELADVDNYPLDNFPGPEDVDRNGNGAFDYGDALAVTWTDSWDDSLPEGCQGDNLIDLDLDGTITEEENHRCFDGLRNFNQIRPGVFDGGYAFNNYDSAVLPAAIQAKLGAFYADRIALNPNLPEEWILPSDYIVEAATPAGYKLMREHHKNVDYGDAYIPSTQAIAPSCVGDLVPVPELLAMATMDGSGDPAQVIPGADAIPAPFATESRPLCDRKQVPLSAAQNAAAEFFLMTDVPKAANVSGVILNDLANEFNPNSPAFGEKFAPPQVPVAFFDWNGNEVSRVYSDTFGRYNAMVPSTFTANLPIPSGMSPNMLVSCMNDAGPIANPAYNAATDDGSGVDADGNPAQIVDPFYNPQYSQFCYTFQYMPGVITYLDTPVEPIAAFAGPGNFPVDCEREAQTPVIRYVKRRGGGQIGPFVVDGQQIRIQSMGNNVMVPNPAWDGIDLAQKLIGRDYRFDNNSNVVELEAADGTRTALTITGQNRNRIFASVTGVAPGDYQVVVTSTYNNGRVAESPIGATLTVGTVVGGQEFGVRPNGNTYNVWSVPGDFATIQEAIGDPTKGQPGVAPGDMILVRPGVYEELVVMWKPVKLQGWGAGAVTLNARQSPTEKILDWRNLTSVLDATGQITRLRGQQLGALGFPGLAENLFPSEEGAGIFVVGRETGANRFSALANRGSRIDGFTIIGASQGGGIVLNGHTGDMNVTNNRVTSNHGIFGGGLRVGHPNINHAIADEQDYNLGGVDQNEVGDVVYDDARNDRVRIRYNHIAQNGNSNGTGGGISLHVGADAYRVQKNWICGNFSKGNGGGIAHFGRSNGGVIEDNNIIFNEIFNQQVGTAPSGAGIFIGGQPALQPAGETGLMLTPGSGRVVVDSNIIRGNLAGAGDGSGIRIDSVNGLDVDRSLGNRNAWYFVQVFNNMINNNVAGVAGAISVTDTLRAIIRNNTVANNDSTATGSQAFDITEPNLSIPQPAGIVSRLHGPVMSQLVNIDEAVGDVLIDPTELGPNRNNLFRASEGSLFSDPILRDNIVYHNRSFFWINSTVPATVPGELPISNTGIYPATDACLASVPVDLTTFDPTTCEGELVNTDDFSDDLAVMSGTQDTGELLDPLFSLLLVGEQVARPATNTFITGDPGFVNGYLNESRDGFFQPEFKTLQTAGAFDEGGNFIQVAFGPLTLLDLVNGGSFDYHLGNGSPAVNNGGPTPGTGRLSVDIDNEPRPTAANLSDIGADEML
ncbi:MAG: right-handed parallel beta-helix repeat-containing protein [Candidatus Thiodiazotropha sp. (ex Monitilora ramsayi)]|nr:right-handed parallel beta-helix repeat-containing protein [Candidatus Thiodiazotropha sp. (ex Monitilora ramsayi)]